MVAGNASQTPAAAPTAPSDTGAAPQVQQAGQLLSLAGAADSEAAQTAEAQVATAARPAAAAAKQTLPGPQPPQRETKAAAPAAAAAGSAAQQQGGTSSGGSSHVGGAKGAAGLIQPPRQGAATRNGIPLHEVCSWHGLCSLCRCCLWLPTCAGSVRHDWMADMDCACLLISGAARNLLDTSLLLPACLPRG